MTKKVFFSFWLLFAINATYSQNALFVHRGGDASIEGSLLKNIQRLSFPDDNLSVKTFDGNEAVYILEDIAKLDFGDVITTDVATPQTSNSIDVIVYVTPAGDVVVESPAAVKSLTLFNIDGKVLLRTVETRHATSLQTNLSAFPTGVYLLHVETEQGTVAKKIIKK